LCEKYLKLKKQIEALAEEQSKVMDAIKNQSVTESDSHKYASWSYDRTSVSVKDVIELIGEKKAAKIISTHPVTQYRVTAKGGKDE
jgi:hypothetical protein